MQSSMSSSNIGSWFCLTSDKPAPVVNPVEPVFARLGSRREKPKKIKHQPIFCLKFRGLEERPQATIQAKEIKTDHTSPLSRIAASLINRIRYNKFNYIQIKTEDQKRIAISIKQLIKCLKFVDEQALLKETKLNLSSKKAIRQAHRTGILEKELQKVSEIRQHFQTIQSKYQKVLSYQKGKEKVLLKGEGGQTIPEKRLLKVIETAFRTFEQTLEQTAKVELEPGQLQNRPYQFYVKKDAGNLTINSLCAAMGEGQFGVILKYFDFAEGRFKVIKRSKLRSEAEDIAHVKEAFKQIQNEYSFLMEFGGNWGVVAKPERVAEIYQKELDDPWELAKAVAHGADPGKSILFLIPS